MRLLTFATGLAAGYVLGTRAGREKYQQIVEGARQLRTNPTTAQAQQTVKTLIGTGTRPGAGQRTATPPPTDESYPSVGTAEATHERPATPATSATLADPSV